MVFRFDEHHRGEMTLRKLYDLASTFGIHGHIDPPSSAGQVIEFRGSNYVQLRVDGSHVEKTVRTVLTGIDTYNWTAIEKYKPLVDRESQALKSSYKELACNYFDRAAPLHRYIGIHRT
jgi:hypothetical protein